MCLSFIAVSIVLYTSSLIPIVNLLYSSALGSTFMTSEGAKLAAKFIYIVMTHSMGRPIQLFSKMKPRRDLE